MNEVEVIIGSHASIAALENPKRKIISVKCTNDFYKRNISTMNKVKANLLKIVDRRILDEEIKSKVHQGVLIKCKKNNFNLDSINKQEKIIVILDSLSDSQNVGSIIRSSFLFGIKSLIYNKDNSFELSPFLIKTSCGAYEKIKLIEVSNLSRTISFLKKTGFWIVGMDADSKSGLDKIPRDLKKVIIFGSENKGIRKLLKEQCDFLAKIDLPEKNKKIDSLNVSNSAAITLYELTKK